MTTMIMVWIRFKMMMVMFGNMWKNKFQTNLDNHDRDDDANISFNINMEDEINDGGD